MPASPSASVFINCPFDERYEPIFEAIVFCVCACGFVPRCTKELPDGGDVRIDNICQLIRECNYSIHDISRTEVEDQPYNLPRQFRRELPALAEEAELNPRQLTFIDYLLLANNWLREHR